MEAANKLGLGSSGAADVKAVFDARDTDGSGLISRVELETLLVELNPGLTAEQINLILVDVDVNKDGSVNYSEFVDWLLPPFSLLNTIDGFCSPFDVCVRDGLLYVCEQGSHRISIRALSDMTKEVASLGSSGSSDGELSSPQAVVVDSQSILVGDGGNKRVCIFDKGSRNFVKSISELQSAEMATAAGHIYLPDFPDSLSRPSAKKQVPTQSAPSAMKGTSQPKGRMSTLFDATFEPLPVTTAEWAEDGSDSDGSEDSMRFTFYAGKMVEVSRKDLEMQAEKSEKRREEATKRASLFRAPVEPASSVLQEGENIIVQASPTSNAPRLSAFAPGQFPEGLLNLKEPDAPANNSESEEEAEKAEEPKKADSSVAEPVGEAIPAAEAPEPSRLDFSQALREICSSGALCLSQLKDLESSVGVFVDDTHAFVVEQQSHRVRVFSKPSGTWELERTIGTGSVGSKDDELSCPFGVCATPSLVFVSDKSNERIQVFCRQTWVLLHSIGGGAPVGESVGASTAGFSSPQGMVVSDDRLVVADTKNNCVKVFSLPQPTNPEELAKKTQAVKEKRLKRDVQAAWAKAEDEPKLAMQMCARIIAADPTVESARKLMLSLLLSS